MPRVSQPPRKLQFSYRPENPAAPDGKSAKRKKKVFAATDRITSEIQRRFQQSGMERLISHERIFIDAAEGRNFATNDLNELLGAHAADFDIRFSAQHVLLPLHDKIPAASECILRILQGKSANMRMMDQVVRYLQLLFSVPASAASREQQSFSARSRIKLFRAID